MDTVLPTTYSDWVTVVASVRPQRLRSSAGASTTASNDWPGS